MSAIISSSADPRNRDAFSIMHWDQHFSMLLGASYTAWREFSRDTLDIVSVDTTS
jgi:hypothetical protein